MKIFLDRRFAVLVVIVVVVLATLLGVRGSLARLSRDVEVMFYEGVYLEGEGYTQVSINSHLESRMSNAAGLATVMGKHPDLAGEAEALLAARRGLLDATSIRDKYLANEAMQGAFMAVVDKAARLDLSQRDIEDIEFYSSPFLGAGTAIRNSGYNQKARAFMDEASFFAHLLRPFLFLRSPQVFA